MIVSTNEELAAAIENKESIIELTLDSGDYNISDVDIDWALKLVMNAGTILIIQNVKIGGVPKEDFTYTCESGTSIGYFNDYEEVMI